MYGGRRTSTTGSALFCPLEPLVRRVGVAGLTGRSAWCSRRTSVPMHRRELAETARALTWQGATSRQTVSSFRAHGNFTSVDSPSALPLLPVTATYLPKVPWFTLRSPKLVGHLCDRPARVGVKADTISGEGEQLGLIAHHPQDAILLSKVIFPPTPTPKTLVW